MINFQDIYDGCALFGVSAGAWPKIFTRTCVGTLAGVLISGCATSYHNPTLSLSDEKTYYSTLEKFTEKKQVYNGFYATVDYNAVIINSAVSRYQVDQYARMYQWSAEKYGVEKSKADSVLAARTEIILSFYTPDKKNDDFNKAKTSWKIFLDVGGKRFEGRAEKVKANLSEIVALYPFHNRWSTPYRLIFDVPTPQVENLPSKLTLTGPLGSTTVEYEPVELKSNEGVR